MEEYFGPSNSVFVSSFNYPNVSVGPLTSIRFEKNIDDPRKWFNMDYNRIIYLRSNTFRTVKKQNITWSNRFVRDVQDVALSSKPVDVEFKLYHKPKFEIKFSNVMQPMGPSVGVKSLKLSSNPKIEKATYKFTEKDMKAGESVLGLYSNFDVYKTTDILSSGSLGLKKKMVPTKWSITAVDDMIGKDLIKKIKDYKEMEEYLVFESEFLGNHYVIMILPGKWEFECFESWFEGSEWGEEYEYESYFGRKEYAKREAGGYYAARLGVLENLDKMKRQARVIVIREISPKYNVPLGVWVCRETTRNAFQNVFKFSSRKDALEFMKKRLKRNLFNYTSRSRLLQQKKLFEF